MIEESTAGGKVAQALEMHASSANRVQQALGLLTFGSRRLKAGLRGGGGGGGCGVEIT